MIYSLVMKYIKTVYLNFFVVQCGMGNIKLAFDAKYIKLALALVSKISGIGLKMLASNSPLSALKKDKNRIFCERRRSPGQK